MATTADLGKLMEMERRLVETYDRIQTDMSAMQGELDQRTSAMTTDMEAMGKRIGDHDQVIRTYFIRVIETFGVFVGIFAIVVVVMLNGGIPAAMEVDDPWSAAILIIGTPATVVLSILVMLYGIKYLILQPESKK